MRAVGSRFVEEPEGLESAWHRLSSVPMPSPKLRMDAYLAAFAIAGQYRLASLDRSFKQFADLDLLLLGS
jgi:predicted nucleic acid-binding protein